MRASRPWWIPSQEVPASQLWWAVEHEGHPAYLLRALMPGDFQPGARGPLPRHAYGLRGEQLEGYPVPCQTCGVVPDPSRLEPIERTTGYRGYAFLFASFLLGKKPWPATTRTGSCWLCSDPAKPVTDTFNGRRVCGTCAGHMRRMD